MRRNYPAGIVVVVLIVTVAAFSLTAWAQPAKPAPVAPLVVWEYKTFQRTVYSGSLDTQLNELGAQGWELCGVHPAQMTPDDVPTLTTVYVFKRAKAADGK